MECLFLIFFLRNLHTVFHSNCLTFISTNISPSLQPCQPLTQSEVISYGGFDLHVPDDQISFEKFLLELLPTFKSSYCFIWIVWVPYIVQILTPCQTYGL